MNLISHYSKDVVKREIYNFSKNRWIALYSNTFHRYDKNGKPLKFNSEDEVVELVKRFNARTIYATAGKYREVTLDNVNGNRIVSYTPFFDIDTTIDRWESAIKAAEVIVSFLEKEGVEKSVYLLWSGEGIHVRINENAIPKNYDPLTAAHAIVQYVLRRTKDEIKKIGVKVDDLIDSKRIFTVPLSFHKELDYVTVCFSPDKLNKFNLEWVKPDNFVYEEGVYNRYEENETEELLLKAIQEYEPRHEGIKEEEVSGKIGRFQVMGIVQAARYYVLYGDLNKAKSFGLNRAIFYAWAKYYGRGYTPKKGKVKVPAEVKKDRVLVNVAGEEVYQDVESGYYIIGDKIQKPEDYDKEIKDKISIVVPYDKAWEATVKYVSSFPKYVLENQRQFYEKVYLPIRDKFLEKVVNRKEGLDAYLG